MNIQVCTSYSVMLVYHGDELHFAKYHKLTVRLYHVVLIIPYILPYKVKGDIAMLSLEEMYILKYLISRIVHITY